MKNMDIIHKLRLLFWALVLTLWSLFMYQFFRPEIQKGYPNLSSALDAMLFKNKTYLGLLQRLPCALRPNLSELTCGPALTEKKPTVVAVSTTTATPRAKFPQPAPQDPALPPLMTTRLVKPDKDIIGIAVGPDLSGQEANESALSAAGLPPLHRSATQQLHAEPHKKLPPQPNWPRPAKGFASKDTKYFTIYREKPEIPDQFVEALNLLHGTLMLDLLPFSPWQGDERVLLYFFSSPETYRKVTGRPDWSVGAASLDLRMIYLLEDRKLMGEAAHELTHIYFDAFFAPAPAPLWLSEGMAVLMQTNRAMSPPQWLGENIDLLRGGKGLPLEEFLRVKNFDSEDFTEERVRLWYAQAYSLSLFLTRLGGPDAFYSFCKNLRDGKTMSQSLLFAYGMPFNRTQALERAWKFDLQTGKITGADH